MLAPMAILNSLAFYLPYFFKLSSKTFFYFFFYTTLFKSKQIIHYNFILNNSAIFVFLYSISCYKSMMESLTSFCYLLEKCCSLPKMLIIFFCNFKFTGNKFHLTDIYNIIFSIYKHINLSS